jgi:peptidoglycan hydrolase-like protein with peptidoglycan-binding domain
MSCSTDRRVPMGRRARAQKRSGRVKTCLAVALLGLVPAVSVAQEPGREGPGDHGDRMVMPTEDAKVLRLARPTVAALQAKLALTGHFEGALNGLYGPSTREAMAAFREERGRAGTGWPDLTTVLRLMGVEEELAGRAGDGLELPAPSRTGPRARSILPGPGAIAGDPQPAKQVRAGGGRMAAENDHGRAVRTLRALVAAVQLRLGEAARYSGPVNGRPDEPGLPEALASWQRARKLEPTGLLDLPTSLRLFGLDTERVRAELDSPITLEASPVAPDEELMRESLKRFSGPLGSGIHDEVREEASDGGE